MRQNVSEMEEDLEESKYNWKLLNLKDMYHTTVVLLKDLNLLKT